MSLCYYHVEWLFIVHELIQPMGFVVLFGAKRPKEGARKEQDTSVVNLLKDVVFRTIIKVSSQCVSLNQY